VTSLAIICLLGFAGAIAAAFWQWQQAEHWRRSAKDAEIKAAQAEATAAAERKSAQEQVQLLENTQRKLEQSFRALAGEALQANSQMFLDRSREQVQGVIGPVQESLKRFDLNVQQMEKARAEAYGGLTAQLKNLMNSERELRQAADQLKNALKAPQQRGRWGEIQLRRAIELAGMLAHCDFEEQVSLDGGRFRPDVVIHLPNGRNVAVDAKVSLDAYLKAVESEDEPERRRLFAEHAKQVRSHVKSLGDKAYWDRLGGSPEFVIAFLPLESIYAAALQQDSELLNFGVEKRVLLATPTTLIAVLYSIAQGWRDRDFAENASRIRELGAELYQRIVQVHGKLAGIGQGLNDAVQAYNGAIWGLESRVFVTARRFRELQGSPLPVIGDLEPVTLAARALAANDWPSQ
jgi:DNA recombination protein RmuC